MLIADKKDQVEIHGDGITVWVNDPVSCIGRFGKNGIDIHKPFEMHGDGTECLLCTHTETSRHDWEVFKQNMKGFYNVEVTDEHMPVRFRQELH